MSDQFDEADIWTIEPRLNTGDYLMAGTVVASVLGGLVLVAYGIGGLIFGW